MTHLRLTPLAVLLAWAAPGLLKAQSLVPTAQPEAPAVFLFSTWNPWAVRVRPRLIPEPIREAAPPLVLPRWNPGTSPNRLALRDLQGEVLVLDFWNRSCPPCIPLHQALVRMAPAWEAQGIRVLSILSTEDPAGLDQFLAEHGGPPPFPILLDRSGTALATFGSRGFPTVLVLDHYGRVAFDLVGGSKRITDLPALFPTLLAARSR